MLIQAYNRWIDDWENRLCFRSNDRVVRPFEWGLDWTENWPGRDRVHRNGDDAESYLRRLNQMVIQHSDEFYAYSVPDDYRLEGGFLRFRSAVESPHPVNNVVHGQWFPAKEHKKRAVIVLPHWNASRGQHVGLCKGIAKFGISALRLSLPYHDSRMPAELRRADFAVSANIGRTVEATRQAVIDIRSCIDWLLSEGYERIGIVGTSLGSCYAFLASAHDSRLRVNVFNHCSTHVADVVWTGLSTIHVRKGLEPHLDVDRLRDLWQAISPANYLNQFARYPHKRSLFIYTAYDTTFPRVYSEAIIEAIQQRGIHNKVVKLPCGHYTMGETPFKFMDGYQIVSFLLRNL